MERLPLSLWIKKETQRKIAQAQDIIVEEVYAIFEKAILHGGTAIWRCYAGKRFSEDIDFYFPKNKEKIDSIFQSLTNKGFQVLKKKISETSVYSELLFERTSVRLEATFLKKEAIITDYETLNGRIIAVYSLTPEMFVIEKAHAYLKRFKIRDLWDIFFLLHLIKNNHIVKKELEHLIKNYKNPIDEADLKIIIFEGIVPSSQEMFRYITQKWENEYI
ncbi:MAG: nucleotidyl transferase AbiEii/AbiGii toxin family protein [Nanoarchaeota archaeon]